MYEIIANNLEDCPICLEEIESIELMEMCNKCFVETHKECHKEFMETESYFECVQKCKAVQTVNFYVADEMISLERRLTEETSISVNLINEKTLLSEQIERKNNELDIIYAGQNNYLEIRQHISQNVCYPTKDAYMYHLKEYIIKEHSTNGFIEIDFYTSLEGMSHFYEQKHYTLKFKVKEDVVLNIEIFAQIEQIYANKNYNEYFIKLLENQELINMSIEYSDDQEYFIFRYYEDIIARVPQTYDLYMRDNELYLTGKFCDRTLITDRYELINQNIEMKVLGNQMLMFYSTYELSKACYDREIKNYITSEQKQLFKDIFDKIKIERKNRKEELKIHGIILYDN